MKTRVDKDLCIGCGLCEGICPKVFEMEEDGKAAAKAPSVPAECEEDVREAAAQCPVEAISIEE